MVLLTDFNTSHRLLHFARSKKDEKTVRVVSSEVPDSVLNAGCKAVLHDIRIAAHGPDDPIYRRNEMIRKMVGEREKVLCTTLYCAWIGLVLICPNYILHRLFYYVSAVLYVGALTS